MLKRRLNRTKKIPDENGEILGHKEFDFREDKIYFISKNVEGSYKWESLKSIEESSNSLFL